MTTVQHPSRDSTLPVAVIGAGPIGLTAAAHLIDRDLDFVIVEQGSAPGASVRQWGHVRMFSAWKHNVDPVAASRLEASGWQAPDPEGYPTGADLLDRLVEPLATLPEISSRLRLRTEALAVSRLGADRQTSRGRGDAPLIVRLRTADGEQEDLIVGAVIDASGTWTHPKPLGAHGLPALGEREAKESIAYGIPDVADRDRARFEGRTVAVVGGGDSAFGLLLELASLDGDSPDERIHWVLRGSGPSFGGGAADQLPARGALGQAVEGLVAGGRVTVHTRFGITRVARRDGKVDLLGGERTLSGIDEVVCVTGFRPDLDLTRELRLDLDPVTEAPSALGPLIDPNVHSCGTVPPHGYRELRHPEPNVYVVGMKSYGRAPTFLLRTGYEQVRSVVAALAGDLEAARAIELELPATGVCSTDTVGPVAASRTAAHADAAEAGRP